MTAAVVVLAAALAGAAGTAVVLSVRLTRASVDLAEESMARLRLTEAYGETSAELQRRIAAHAEIAARYREEIESLYHDIYACDDDGVAGRRAIGSLRRMLEGEVSDDTATSGD